MKLHLERRLQALETRLFGSPRVAAYLRELFAMSSEELTHTLEMAESDPNFMDQRLRHLSKADLDHLISLFERRLARSAVERKGEL
jgi:hypothetical protein